MNNNIAMNTKDVLNAHLYPNVMQDVRRKDFPYYDQLNITTGTMEYFFFTTPLGNQFLRNKQLPLAGSEVFFIEEISAVLKTVINTAAELDSLNELLQQSYLQISVDNRIQCKIPGMDFIQYQFVDDLSDQVVVTNQIPSVYTAKRVLPIPILMNSTSSFEFKFVTTAAAATAFNGIALRLTLEGLQLDKLKSFYWDNLKMNQFQQIPVTYYQTQVIANGDEVTFNLFANPAAAQTLFSKTFPLSDIQTFACQNIELLFNQPDTPIDPLTIFISRITNVLKITVDDVEYYNGSLQDMLSVVAGLELTLTTTPDLDCFSVLNIRNSKTFRIPLMIPANSKVSVSLTQPAGSLGVTGEFTIAMRGVETRRVA